MSDYHVFSTSDLENEPLTDHGVVHKVSDIPWAGLQLLKFGDRDIIL